jgi:hypothetical protein
MRPRSTTALIASRSDPSVPAAEPVRPNRLAVAWKAISRAAVAPRARTEPRVWPTVLTWTLLGGAIAGLWALLLLGDSLKR